MNLIELLPRHESELEPASRASDRVARQSSPRRHGKAMWIAAAVLGIPFLYFATGAAGGSLFAGRHFLFGQEVQLSAFLACTAVGGLGSLWLGASLLLGFVERLAESVRDTAAALFIFVGVAILLFVARFLSVTTSA